MTKNLLLRFLLLLVALELIACGNSNSDGKPITHAENTVDSSQNAVTSEKLATNAKLDDSKFEIVKHNASSSVDNYHILVKHIPIKKANLNQFTEDFRSVYCNNKNCNLWLYDDKSVVEYFDLYPCPKKEYLKLADHFVGESSFDSPEIWLYPYQDVKYKEYGGKNWKKERIK